MIETKVPKDIRSYKTKIIGPFSLRQLICLVVAILVDGLAYLIISSMGIKLSMNLVIYGVMFIDLPILAFIIEPQGMPMEKYIQKVLLTGFLKPSKRKAETLLYEDQKKTPLTKKEKKERIKKINAVGRKHPELKAFD